MRSFEKVDFYAELKSHFTMLQTNARTGYEYCIATRAALDPEGDEERHELTFRADKACADMLRYERTLMYIAELQEIETGCGSLMWLEKSHLNSLYGMMVGGKNE